MKQPPWWKSPSPSKPSLPTTWPPSSWPVPLGVVYTVGVQLGAHALERLGPETRDRLVRRCSTNVDNLDAGRWETLLGSAFTVEEPMPLPYALLLVAVLGYAEYAYGAWWTAAVFLFGHAAATLLVYGALRGRADRETRRALDVGTSYGFNTVLGALTSALPRGRVRGAARVGLLVLAARPVVKRGRTFTDAGHLVALGLGLGISLAVDCLSGANHQKIGLDRPA
ncbi:rhomboid-like protein [Streptomyces cirratus]|uniref:rhomboid-like protein n=1 Tax=Streptomyces cirratus TaxID=68187 RepID=UPI00167DABE0|nr:rhomboid-like protein [Streptomyces cirratus]